MVERRFLDGLALRILRMSKKGDLSRKKLCERINPPAQGGDGEGEERGGIKIRPERLGEYERGEKDIPLGELHHLLNALDYPMDAWLATRNHLEWLGWTGSRHVGSQGQVVDAEIPGRLSWIYDADGSLDRDATRRELRRVVRDRARSQERQEEELLEFVLALLLAADRG